MTDVADIVSQDMSTLLVARAMDAAEIGPPEVPEFVALPGAKAAISHDRLIAHQEAGHDQRQIVARINERWHAENGDRLTQHKRWVAGPYHGAVQELRRRQMESAAEELRRKALFEQLMAERDA